MPLVAPLRLACACAILLPGCSGRSEADGGAATAKSEPVKSGDAKAEPAKRDDAKAEPAKSDDAKSDDAEAEPAEPEPRLAGDRLTFALGGRTFTGVVALASQFNGKRNVLVASMPYTCEELLAVPEVAKPGLVTLRVITPWTTGKHPLTSAEILEDAGRKSTSLYADDGTIEVQAGPDRAGERGVIKVAIRDAQGSASGVIDVELCE